MVQIVERREAPFRNGAEKSRYCDNPNPLLNRKDPFTELR